MLKYTLCFAFAALSMLVISGCCCNQEPVYPMYAATYSIEQPMTPVYHSTPAKFMFPEQQNCVACGYRY